MVFQLSRLVLLTYTGYLGRIFYKHTYPNVPNNFEKLKHFEQMLTHILWLKNYKEFFHEYRETTELKEGVFTRYNEENRFHMINKTNTFFL